MKEDVRFIALAKLIRRYGTTKFLLLKEFAKDEDAPKGINVAGSWVFLLEDVEEWERRRTVNFKETYA